MRITVQDFEKELKQNLRNNSSIVPTFRALAGSKLERCARDSFGILESNGLHLSGSDTELTEEILMNAVLLSLSKESYEGKTTLFSMDMALLIAKNQLGISAEKSDISGMFSSACENFTDGFKSKTEEYDDYDWDDEDEFEFEEEEEDPGELEDYSDEEDEDTSKNTSDDYTKIKQFYYQYYMGVISELSKRYTSLFQSGYEITKPDGILCNDGLVSLSGTQRVINNYTAPIVKTYAIFKKKMGISEKECRSNIKIADTIYSSYMNQEAGLLYFPNKLLEFAYGRECPKGDNRDSLNTYEKHANSSNWSEYRKKEVERNLLAVVEGSVVKFVVTNSETEEEKTSLEMEEEVLKFLEYVKTSLSTCLMFVDYKSTKKGYMEDVHSYKLRICDPQNALGTYDYNPVIIKEAFINATGSVPFSYEPRLELETMVKEYAHEFNHDSAQASPLFAYKAYLSLQEQQVNPDWNNMILGMFEDGTILKNNTHGVNLNDNLTHHICAGSRAGKGVMTLNTLICGIYSRKNIFYLDRKPDMASMFKYLSPNMFVVNGGIYGDDDSYGTFRDQNSWLNPLNIPDYVCTMLGKNKTWEDLGDLFYMRALKLVMGIIFARGAGAYKDARFGGEQGILLVADEFKNFQESYAAMISRMVKNLPVAEDKFFLEKAKVDKLAEKNGEDDKEYLQALRIFNKSYNLETYYALSYLNTMVSDLEYESSLRDAGFSPIENSLSDIFVIGQHLEHGSVDFAEFRNMLTSNRYKSIGRRGISSTPKVNFSKDSFGFSLVSFKKYDAFFGRNWEDGRDVYLAQRDKNSKACGRLDDKASNFAYMSSFSDDKRSRIVGGDTRDNIELANSCVYFKPFLVLNDCQQSGPNARFVEQMFARCAGPDKSKPWITPEELIAENPNADGSFLNPAVGFEGYLNLMGASNYSQILAKGSDIANFVVQQCMGYDGNWLQFITDLRPQSLFTVKDVVTSCMNVFNNMPENMRQQECWRVKILESEDLREFVDFAPEIFGLNSFGEPDDYPMDSDSVEMFMEQSKLNDYSNMEVQQQIADEELGKLFGDEEVPEEYDNNEDLDLFDDFYEDIVEEKDEEVIDFHNGRDYGTGFGSQEDVEHVLNQSKTKEAEILDLLSRLKELGLDIGISENGWSVIGTPEQNMQGSGYTGSHEGKFQGSADSYYGKGLYTNQAGDFFNFEDAEESFFNEKIPFRSSVETLEDLVELITGDIISKFGGLENIVSFKVVGGSIVVNGYYYRCKISDLFSRGIPYDVRREMNSGNISRLFNYSNILYMSHLRDLEFDSLNFVYDYVSTAMGYGNKVSVDLFFNDLRALQVLTIGRRKFHRNDYMSQIQGDDIFYSPRRATRLADASESFLNKVSKKSWSFTKDSMNRKDYGKVIKTAGVVGGAALTATAIVSKTGIKATRKVARGIKSLGSTLSDMYSDYKNMNK